MFNKSAAERSRRYREKQRQSLYKFPAATALKGCWFSILFKGRSGAVSTKHPEAKSSSQLSELGEAPKNKGLVSPNFRKSNFMKRLSTKTSLSVRPSNDQVLQVNHPVASMFWKNTTIMTRIFVILKAGE